MSILSFGKTNVNLVPRVLSLPRESTLVTAGHVSARSWQIPEMWLKGGAREFKVCLHSVHPLSPIGSGICNPLWIGKTHSEGIGTFHIGVQCDQCLAIKGFLRIWLNFSRRQLNGLKNLWLSKKLAKNLKMTTEINGSRGEFNFIIYSAQSKHMH